MLAADLQNGSDEGQKKAELCFPALPYTEASSLPSLEGFHICCSSGTTTTKSEDLRVADWLEGGVTGLILQLCVLRSLWCLLSLSAELEVWWVRFEGEHGEGNILHPHQIPRWPCYFMDWGDPPLNKQPSFSPPEQLVFPHGSVCHQPMPSIRGSFL